MNITKEFWLGTFLLFSGCASPSHKPAQCNERLPAGESTLLANPSADIRDRELPAFQMDAAPWLHLEANSEQRQPVYLGTSPRDLEIPRRSSVSKKLPKVMKERGERLAQAVRRSLGLDKFRVEAWPVRDDHGLLTWTFARWRTDQTQPWNWIEASNLEKWVKKLSPPPILPETKDLSKTSSFEEVFNDFLEMKDLYTKPLFGDCVWTSVDGTRLLGAWLKTTLRESHRDAFLSNPAARKEVVCRVLPMPSRMNGAPTSYEISIDGARTTWPSNLIFGDEDGSLANSPTPETPVVVKSWPADFMRAYQEDVKTLSGEREAIFPLSGKRIRFTRKNSAQKDHQLSDMVDYLSERYEALGIKTKRDEFTWRGIPQANLIAVIPGSLQGPSNKPVLMADHFDSAFAEEVFARSGRRVSVPGADDNISATAALLRAAEILKASRPRHDIWLVHITGEEYPGDDLGARNLISGFLKNKQDITGFVLLDMIAFRKKGDRVFQLSAGDSEESRRMAESARQASVVQARNLSAAVRTRFDPKSYLYNTDGLIFSDVGYPVVLFNEHLNYFENIDRKGYHDMADTDSRLDWNYATPIVKTAIETTGRLAGAERVP